MPAVDIRNALPLDIEQATSLACQAAPERGCNGWREELVEDLQHEERLLIVAEIAGEIVGYGRARLFERTPDAPVNTAPDGYYLTGVFVHPDHRRSGIGAALTNARLHWIGKRADEAWFFANARNTASVALHRRFGFEEITRDFSFPGLAFDGGEGILFRSRLTAAPLAR